MSDIVLTKPPCQPLSEEQQTLLRESLFALVDGHAESDKKAWRRFWQGVLTMGSGECVSIKTLMPRAGLAHRRQMVLEAVVFKHQSRLKEREEFRLWLKVGSGWVTWASGPKGGVFPVPKSVSYARCDEEQFARYCEGVHAFLRSEHARKYLWPAKDAAATLAWIEELLG